MNTNGAGEIVSVTGSYGGDPSAGRAPACWNNGNTIRNQWNAAIQYPTVSLIYINQWNEFAEQGSAECSNDIEPTLEWGYDRVQLIGNLVTNYLGLPQLDFSSEDPKGVLNWVNCDSFGGWTCDGSDYSKSIDVQFYKDIPDAMGVWHFDEGSGNVAKDNSGNNYNGAIHGATWFNRESIFHALSFDGSSNYVEINSASGFPPTGNNPFTLSAWINPNSMSDNYILSFGQQVKNGMNALALASTQVCHYFWGNDQCTPVSDILHKWTHVAVTYDGSKIKIFVNGNLASTQTPSSTPNVQSSNVAIGIRLFDKWSAFNGLIDEVHIFNRALSDSEIHDLYGQTNSLGIFIGKTNANVQREQAVGDQCGGNVNHGFVFNTPASLKDGKQHTIYAYTINTPYGYNPQLSGSPKTLSPCLSTTTTTTLQPQLKLSSITCSKTSCNLQISTNTIQEPVKIYTILMKSPEGIIYYTGTLSIPAATTATQAITLSSVQTCPTGTQLQSLVLAYKESDPTNRISRLIENVLVC